jgi:DNA repair exonuclease SbcCD ATPase subunit
LAKLSASLQQSQDGLSAKTQEAEALRSELSKKEDTINDLKEELVLVNNKCEAISADKEKLQNERDNLQSNKDALEALNKRLEELDGEKKELLAAITVLQSEKESLNEKVVELKSANEKSNDRLVSVNTDSIYCWNNIITPLSSFQNKAISENCPSSEATRQPVHNNTSNIIDQQLRSFIEDMESKKKWPLTTRRLLQFHNTEELNTLRCHMSVTFPHKQERTHSDLEATSYVRLKCALCTKGTAGRQTTHICGTCKVPLCTELLQGEDKSAATHFSLWHTCINLKSEQDRCNLAFLASNKKT